MGLAFNGSGGLEQCGQNMDQYIECCLPLSFQDHKLQIAFTVLLIISFRTCAGSENLRKCSNSDIYHFFYLSGSFNFYDFNDIFGNSGEGCSCRNSQSCHKSHKNMLQVQ